MNAVGAERVAMYAAVGALALVLAASWSVAAGTSPLTATSTVSAKLLHPGESAEVTVNIVIADGWHINGSDPGLSFLIPTSLDFELPAGVRVAGVRYPQPETRRLKVAGDKPLKLYRGTVDIGATLIYGASGGGAQEPVAILHYQACNDTVCLRPTTLRLNLPLALSGNVGARRFADGSDAPDSDVTARPTSFNTGQWSISPGAVLAAQAQGASAATGGAKVGIKLEPFTTQAYDRARVSGEPFVIEFTADWCEPCRELRERTFADPSVVREARGVRFLSVDMTAPNVQVERILESFRIPGAPTTLVFGSDGKERTRRIGFIDAGEFLRLLRDVKATTAPAGPAERSI